MKKKIILLSAIAGILFTTACQNFEKGPGGLEYKIVKDAGNDKAVSEDFLAVDMIVKSDRDSVLSSTYDLEFPQIVNIAPDTVPGIYDGDYNTMFKLLGEGDSAVFKINLDTMSANVGQPKPDFADQHIIFNVKVRKHFKKGDLDDSTFFSQVDEYYKEVMDELKDSEEKKLASYVSKNKLEPQKTESGLQYIIDDKGSDQMPEDGDTVVVNYVGSLTNDKVFDTNIEETAKKENNFNPGRDYEPLKLRLGHDPVIEGWTEGMKLIGKGGKATLLIPSNLGYGEQGGGGDIPPYAPLVFQVELVDIITGPTPEEEKAAEEEAKAEAEAQAEAEADND